MQIIGCINVVKRLGIFLLQQQRVRSNQNLARAMDAIVDILADDFGTPGMINRTQRFRKIIVTASVSGKRLLTISLLQEQLNCLVADVWQITGDH